MRKRVFPLLVQSILLLLSCNDMKTDEQSFPQKQNLTRTQGDGQYETLGYGYDITGEYLDFYSIKKPVVDIDAFIQNHPSKYHNPFIGKISSSVYAGEDFKSYMRAIQEATEYNFSLNFTSISKDDNKSEQNAAFGGGTKSERSSSYEYSSKYSFARVDIIKRHKQYVIDASPEELSHFLTADFAHDLDNLPASDIIKKYGTHVLLNIEAGGIYTFFYKSQIIHEKSNAKKSSTVSAGIKGLIQKFGINIGGTSSSTEETQLESNNIAWECQIESNGGSRNGLSLSFTSQTSIPNTSINIDNWAASVDDTHSVLVKINWDNAFPIYDFILDHQKKASIQHAVKEYLEEATVSILEVVPLYRIDRSDTRNTYNVYGDEELYYLLNVEKDHAKRKYDGLVGYVLKNAVDEFCEPLYSIDNSRYNNTFTIMGDSELHYYLHVLHGFKDRKLDGQTGYAYRDKRPHTELMYRIDNSKFHNTFSVVGEDEKNYYLYQLNGYQNRSLDGTTGYIYPPTFN